MHSAVLHIGTWYDNVVENVGKKSTYREKGHSEAVTHRSWAVTLSTEVIPALESDSIGSLHCSQQLEKIRS